MDKLNLYEAIFNRKSVRKYDLKSIEDKTLIQISDFINSVKPLFSNIKTEMRIVNDGEVKSLIPIKAPHYLLMYSENKEGYITNAGYMLQQVDLFLSLNSIGSCYLGMAQPKIANSELEFVMVLAFGYANEPVHRADISEFNRKSLSQITDIANIDKLLECVRLAPSATNSQPWLFKGSSEEIYAYCMKPNIIKAFIYEKMNKFDMGIALCHLFVAAEHYGKNITFSYDKTLLETAPKGHYYIMTANLK